ncbi:hypothetical protein ALT761_00307 [Alteromonas sp. 76-1]|nr:hypothetical protein ALT761_00307 [Alteromonas sp. 76-1]
MLTINTRDRDINNLLPNLHFESVKDCISPSVQITKLKYRNLSFNNMTI